MKKSIRPLVAIGGLALILIAGAIWLSTRPKQSEVETPNQLKLLPQEPEGPTVFEDVTAMSGVASIYRNGEEANRYTILESLGGGVAVLDFDGDGLLDLFFTNGGSFQGETPQILGLPSKLYRNLGNWKFEDVTSQVGLNQPLFYSHGTAVADYDRDGFPDLLVTGWNRTVLYHNIPDGKGGRRFEDMSQKAGLTDTRWASSAAWGDLDGDGFPDLYICYYVDWSFLNDPACPGAGRDVVRDVCAPQKFGPLQHRLYRNQGDGAFTNVTTNVPLRPDGKGLGVVIADLDLDGKPDIYVANDAGENFLYFNKGGMKFEERGSVSGTAVDDVGLYNGSMGVDVADYEGNGRPGIWVTNFQGEIHALYRNMGKSVFRHESQAAGVARLGRQFVGFGTGFIDFDNDGWEDLVITNGHVLRHPVGSTLKQRPILLHNESQENRRQFREIPGKGGPYFRGQYAGRGLAIADLDNDGWPDLVIAHQNEPAVLLRNAAVNSQHRDNQWLGISLVGRDRRDVVGATLELKLNDRTLTRFTKGGGSYLSSNDSRIRFGLGTAKQVGQLKIRWPNGKQEVFDGLLPGHYWKITEGNPKAEQMPTLK